MPEESKGIALDASEADMVFGATKEEVRNLTFEERTSRVRALVEPKNAPAQEKNLALLQRIATRLSANTGESPKDLIHEAITRIWEGTRKTWRSDVPTLDYLKGVMESIAYDLRKGRSEYAELHRCIEDLESQMELKSYWEPEDRWDAEMKIRLDELLQNCVAKLDGDDLAIKLLFLRINGYEKESIIKILQINATEYNTRMKTLSRKLKQISSGEA